MSERLSNKLSALKQENRAGFVPFIMAGDPSLDVTQHILAGLPDAGADIIELGMPFSDPMADGPVIQAAGLRALEAGTTLKDVLELAKTFRESNNNTPIILMGYSNPIYHYGVDAFMQEAANAGVDGLIIVDIPQEEFSLIDRAAAENNIDIIRLIAPTSLASRLHVITQNASGFLYYISVKGITGGVKAESVQLEDDLKTIRHASTLPIAVGFGIKTPDDVRNTAQHADLVVVGSAIVSAMAEQSTDTIVEHTLAHIKRLSDGLKH